MKRLVIFALALGQAWALAAQARPFANLQWLPATHSGYWENGQEWQQDAHDSIVVRMLYAGRMASNGTVWLMEVENHSSRPINVFPEDVRFRYTEVASKITKRLGDDREPAAGSQVRVSTEPQEVAGRCPTESALPPGSSVYNSGQSIRNFLHYFVLPQEYMAEDAIMDYGYFRQVALFRHTLRPGQQFRRLVFAIDCDMGLGLEIIAFLDQRDYVLRFERRP